MVKQVFIKFLDFKILSSRNSKEMQKEQTLQVFLLLIYFEKKRN